MGLWITKNILKLMDGDIKVKSKLQLGSNFILAFPAVVGDETPALLQSPEDGKLECLAHPLTCLLLDDIPENTFIMREALSRYGIQSVCMNEGSKALELCRTQRFDFVVTDLRMPNMSGQTFILELRRLEREAGTPSVPIIVVTGENSPDEKRLCLTEYGANEFLIKPIKQKELLEAIVRSRTHSSQPPRAKRLLLIDDEAVSLQVLATFLRTATHQPVLAQSVAEVHCTNKL